MDIDKEKVRLYEEAQALVVKDNIFLRQSRAELSVIEQKLIIYLISKVKADDKTIKPVVISVKDFCKLTNIEAKGANYTQIKESIKSLKKKTWWIDLDENRDLLYSWFDYVVLKKNTGEIEIALSQFLAPYIISLKSNFTRYRLREILNLKSKHSIKIYELCASFLYKGRLEISLDNLKHYLGIDGKYNDYRDFRKSVLDLSVKDINENTYLYITYEPIKHNKRVEGIEIKINEATGYQLSFLDE